MTAAKTPSLDQSPALPNRLVLNFRAVKMTQEEFLQFCSDNDDPRMELSASKELIILPPGGRETGWQGSELTRQSGNWAVQDGSGRAFGSN